MSQPLYKKIFEDLKKEILQGKRPVESQLPTEKELSELYEVSRITSKRALTELEQEGYIYRVQGSGSFVKPRNGTLASAAEKNKILFILPFSNNAPMGNFNEGFYPPLQERGMELLMTPSSYLDGQTTENLMNEFDGLLYYAENTESHIDLLYELAIQDFPVVILDKIIYDLPFPTVLPDNFEGGKIAAERLIQLGHERIAYIFGSEIHPQSVRQRYLGYLDGLNNHRLDFRTQLDDNSATITNAATYLHQNEITAAVCENDITAIELMRQLKQLDSRIPEDFSVFGFDNIQAASLVEIPLSTIAQNFKALGQLAAQTLLEEIQQTSKQLRVLKVPVSLIERNSTATVSREIDLDKGEATL